MMSPPLRLTVLAITVAGWAMAAVAAPTDPQAQVPADTVEIVEVRVHGNYRTSDADVIALTGVTIGDRLTDGQIADVEQRLRDSHQFDEVEVRKRFRSLTETDRAVLLILVHERVVPADVNPLVSPFKRAASQLMFLPVLDYTEGYGFTYGGRVSLVDWLGAGERISVPLTWGGDKRAALEIDRTFTRDRISRIAGGAAIFTRKNPHFGIDDHRVEGWMRAEHEIVRDLTIGGRVDWADVTFGELGDRQTTYGIDATFDTRAEPAFPRNAVAGRGTDSPLRARRPGVRGAREADCPVGEGAIPARQSAAAALGPAASRWWGEPAWLQGRGIRRRYPCGGIGRAPAAARLAPPHRPRRVRHLL